MKFNLKKIIVILLVILLGVMLSVADTYWIQTENHLWLSVGCSLIASAMVGLLNVFLVEGKVDKSFDEWKISKIYSTRADKNKDSDPKLKDLKYRLDGVAFGLKTFRTGHYQEVEEALRRGVMIRFITMSPNSKFVAQREKEENEQTGQIRKTIKDLVAWADSLNAKNYKGKIYVKGYNCMTLDFYWRMDGEIYMGPYWYGHPSQQTITYKFDEYGKGFDTYEKYFEELWNDKTLLENLTAECV